MITSLIVYFIGILIILYVFIGILIILYVFNGVLVLVDLLLDNYRDAGKKEFWADLLYAKHIFVELYEKYKKL